MSVSLMSLVWDRAPYEGGTLLVLLALADWADDAGVTWPSVATLAGKARMQVRNAQYILRTLEAEKMITRVSQGSGRATTVYRLNVEALCAMPLAWKRPGPTPPPLDREQNEISHEIVPMQNLHDATDCTPAMQPNAPLTCNDCTPAMQPIAPQGCTPLHPIHHRSTNEPKDPLPPDELGVKRFAMLGEGGEQKPEAHPGASSPQADLNRTELRLLLTKVWREWGGNATEPDASPWPHAPPGGPAP